MCQLTGRMAQCSFDSELCSGRNASAMFRRTALHPAGREGARELT